MKILSDKEPIDIFCEASNILNKAVIHTLGPKGTNTAVQTKEGYYEIINDGKSIIEPITSLEPDLAPALETLKQSSFETNRKAGDGTTSTIVLMNALLQGAKDFLNQSTMSEVELRNLLDKVESNLISELDNVRTEVSEDDYEKVAEVIGLTAEKIKSGETILGVEGTYEGNAGDDVSNYISSEKGTGITNGRLTDYIVQIPMIDTSEVTSMGNMFQYFNMLKTIPLIDTSKVTTMTNMFSNCYSLQTIPLINTSEVTSMSNMFEYCYSLQTIPLIDTSKVTSMGNMFNHCETLTSIPQIDTSKVTSMGSMFAYCSSLQTVPVLDFSSATSMYKVFNYCEALSNDSLNNILASLLTATSYKGTKNLKYIGLTETQAQTCTTLSNWAACEEAGWTTGY